MRRRDFVKMCAVLGIAGPVVACGGDDELDEATGDPGGSATSVLIVGAGAAGLSAGYLLTQQGIDCTILEAGSTHGGRIRRADDFVDFPIPLGGEWLHDEADVLADIVADDAVEIGTELVGYEPDDQFGFYDGAELTIGPLGEYTDLKFVGATWLDFFDTYVVPGIADKMVFDTVVERIDHGGDQVVVTDAAGTEYSADFVVVTVPLTILRDGDIEFVPDLDEDRRAALADADVWGGMKVFVEFSERFYPTFVAFPDSDTREGQRVYYDAAYGQRSEAHVLGLFAVGAPAEPYQARTGDELRDHILAELDEVFDGAASPAYLGHIAQNWSAEPFVRQAYLADHADWQVARELGRPGGDRLYFAGDAYTDGENWSEVHVAAASARTAVEAIIDRL
ncbi:MAG: flavin monoamine oxidase family protein [Acidimicrobiales bacterium]